MTRNILLMLLGNRSRHFSAGLVFVPLLWAGASIAQTPFTCTDQASYVTHAPAFNVNASTGLYRVDLMNPQENPTVTIAEPLIVPVSGNKVNAIGYNVLDNFIWGSATGTSSIVKIGSDGIVQSFAVPGLPAANYTAGDVDQAGNLYLYLPDALVMYKINVATLALTTITLSAGSTLGDISVNANGSKIFGFSNGGDLVTYTVSGTSASVTSVFLQPGVPDGAYNTFLDSRGYLYAQHSTRGDTFLMNPLSASPAAQRVGPARQAGAPSELTPFGDGARCPASEIVVQLPVSCESAAYTLNDISQDATCHGAGTVFLYKIDFQTGVRTEIGAQITRFLGNGHLNALALNPTDGYLWAFRLGTSQMVRIGADGTTKYFPLEGFITNDDCGPSLFAADIDKNGVMYAFTGRPSNNLVRIDLNPASPTFLTVLSTLTMTNVPVGEVADIAFNPKDNLLYGISAGQHVFRIDPSTGVGTDLGATGVPSGSGFNVVTDLFDAAGNLYYQISSSASLFMVKNTHLGNTAAFSYRNDLAPPVFGDGASCGGALLAGVRISGNVWDDANGNAIKAGGELNTVTDVGGQTLTIYLLDTDGFIVAKTAVANDGTWFIERIPTGTFSVVLTNDASLQVGTITPVPSTLPGSGMWVNTGINFPGTTGIQLNTNAGTLVVSTFNISNIDFGIEKKPLADGKLFDIGVTPSSGASIVLNGSWTATTPPTQLTGTDFEDGGYDGVTASGSTTNIQIISLPVAVNGTPSGGLPELYYNGVLVTPGMIIANYDQNNLAVMVNGTGYRGFEFTYQTIDAAGRHSETAAYRVTWNVLPVKLIAFSVIKENEVARFGWSTSEEVNADRFEMERSADARSWAYLGVVMAKGDSRIRQDYTFDDMNPKTGANYYRLKMIDRDDTYTYSRLLNVGFAELTSAITPYPNPVADKLFFTALPNEKLTDVSVTNTSGQVIYKSVAVPSEGIDVKSLPNGLYFVSFKRSNGLRDFYKILVNK